MRPLIKEIAAAIDPIEIDYEIVIVDDGSSDETPAKLLELMKEYPVMRAIQMKNTPPGMGLGQSAAFHAGFRAARGEIIAVLDADLQNDPADIPAMLELMMKTGVDVVQGDRSHNRRDHIGRRLGWLVGLMFRRILLGDTIRDTGCSLRVMRRAVALAIPLEYRGMHRFIPFTARQLGFSVIEMSVNHRPRTAGEAKYGTWNRALPGLFDCFAVRWMRNRRRNPASVEIHAESEELSRSNPQESRPLEKVAG